MQTIRQKNMFDLLFPKQYEENKIPTKELSALNLVKN